MGGYKREREYVWTKYQKRVETCHVAHVKRSLGLITRQAANRLTPDVSVKPCPPDLWPMVEEAVRHVHGL